MSQRDSHAYKTRDDQDPRRQTERRRDANLARIGRVVAVMSGKGGVGKSTVAAALALGLARRGRRTGLLDVDFHGPSIPILLGLTDAQAAMADGLLQPIAVGERLRVMSLGLLLGPGDQAVIWRGPMKIGVLNQLLGDVAWGDLDVLVLDCPPGTGDEVLSIGQVIPKAEVVMVGTPQEMAMADVRRAVTFCRQLGLRVLGLVETMGTVRCPACGAEVPLFAAPEGTRAPLQVPVLARVPFDPALRSACDAGRLEAFLAAGGPTAEALDAAAEHLAGPPAGAAGHAAAAPSEAPADPAPAGETPAAPAPDTTSAPQGATAADPVSDRASAGALSGGSATAARAGPASAAALEPAPRNPDAGGKTVRYAIPTADGMLTPHFGHADLFTLVDVEDGNITKVETVRPPAHAPGVLPAWCRENGVDVVIAGGMGRRAQALFAEAGIQVVVGAPAEAPEALVRRHLAGTLETGENVCDH